MLRMYRISQGFGHVCGYAATKQIAFDSVKATYSAYPETEFTETPWTIMARRNRFDCTTYSVEPVDVFDEPTKFYLI